MMKQLILPLLAAIIPGAGADEYNHRYAEGDRVDLWVNKVGPYANPQEAYEYYTLPYCAPNTRYHPDNKTGIFNALKAAHSIGEILGGHGLRHSGHDLIYPSVVSTPAKTLRHSGLDFLSSPEETGILETCTTSPLTDEQVKLFTTAAEDQWFYQMYVDDLPMWGMVGEMLPDLETAKGEHFENEYKENRGEFKPYVFTKKTLLVSYNGDMIIKVDLTSESLMEVKAGVKVKFELDIQWTETNTPFHSRFDRYLDHVFFKHQINWFMMDLFLMGLMVLILLRTLRKDYARYAISHRDGEEGGDSDAHVEDKDDDETPLLNDVFRALPVTGAEDNGHKQKVHNNVIRPPMSPPSSPPFWARGGRS